MSTISGKKKKRARKALLRLLRYGDWVTTSALQLVGGQDFGARLSELRIRRWLIETRVDEVEGELFRLIGRGPAPEPRTCLYLTKDQIQELLQFPGSSGVKDAIRVAWAAQTKTDT